MNEIHLNNLNGLAACGRRSQINALNVTHHSGNVTCHECKAVYAARKNPVGKLLNKGKITACFSRMNAWSDDVVGTVEFEYVGAFTAETAERVEAAVLRQHPPRAGWGCGGYSCRVTAIIDLAKYGTPGRGLVVTDEYFGTGD